jgi:hypothetical protein
MDGRGVESWGDGRRYEGDFKNGKKDGEGSFEWPNGNRYVGSWQDGKQHGMGIWITRNGPEGASKRQGEWVNGKRHRWITTGEILYQASPASYKGYNGSRSKGYR